LDGELDFVCRVFGVEGAFGVVEHAVVADVVLAGLPGMSAAKFFLISGSLIAI
jgi:hypothetical protein